MNTITHSQRYLPHELNTKYYAVKLYRTNVGVSFVYRRYHISKSSLMRWNKKFDGTKESLMDKSHRPLSKHPNAHSDQEIKWIKDYHRWNPKISVCELYGKLRTNKRYSRHPGSLYRVYRRLGYSSYAPSTKNRRKPKPYDTPLAPGIKWQMDVKYVPAACYSGSVPPEILQADNGDEFTHIKKTDHTHPLDVKCIELGIQHKRIRPRTPWHNGKAERSHRNDQELFYNHMSFYSYDDLLLQMKRYMNRSNNIPMQVLGWKSPLEKRLMNLKYND